MSSKTIRIALLGDVMLGRGVNEEIGLHPPGYFWGTTLPLLQSMDAVFANLECAITTHTLPWSKTYKHFHFRADPKAVQVLQGGNIRCVSLANNHALDYEYEGLLDSLKYLDEAGITHAGAGENLFRAKLPAIVRVKDTRIGFIAYTDNEPAFAALEVETPGCNYQEINSHPETIARLDSDIRYVKREGADVIILSLHWGGNWPQMPSPVFQTFARDAIAHGVNIVYGHSPHIFQAAELHEKRLILYSTGDFLDDYAVNPELRNDWSFIFIIELQGSHLQHVQAIPVRLQYAQTNLARGKEAQAICERMQKLCKAFHLSPTMKLGSLELYKANQVRSGSS